MITIIIICAVRDKRKINFERDIFCTKLKFSIFIKVILRFLYNRQQNVSKPHTSQLCQKVQNTKVLHQ